MTNPHLLFIDLFCGAGGVTAGIERSKVFDKRVATVIGCVNHDANAIASHAANHPDALHFTEDIRTLDLTDLMTHTYIQKTYYPDARLCLWASLECTNFSKAKGGLPRDADSRTLAEHLFRYLNAAEANVGGFDYIFIENVEEFMSWGPVDENGKPISKKAGEDYLRWVQDIQNYGYKYDFRILNAADYGDYTSRKRYFGVFAKRGLPMAFPKPTHGKVLGSRKGKVVKHDLFCDTLKPWKPVKEVLNFEDTGESIFGRKKPLSEKTLERIYAGLVKFVAKGDTSFLKKYYSGRPMGKVNSTEEPSPTVTTFGNMQLVQASFIHKYNGRREGTAANAGASVDEPAPTVTTHGRMSLVNASFLSYYYSTGHTNSGLEQPCGTLTTKDRANLIMPHFFLDKQYGTGRPASVEQPAGSLTTSPKLNLVKAEPWVMNTNYSNVGSSIHEPAQVITANRKHHYLMNPCYGNQVHSVDEPSPTVIARQDKAPLQYVQADEANVVGYIVVYDDDSAAMVKIKQFMAAYGLVDIKMRGLRIPELKRITGFPDSYVLIGNQAEQKKFIGNAVPVNLARAIIESFAAVVVEFDNVKMEAAA